MTRKLLLLSVLFLACFSLDSFLFYPTRVEAYFQRFDTAWHVRGVIPDSLVEEVLLYPVTGETVYGFFVRSDSGGTRTTIIYSHGNGDNINRYWGRVELLWEMGYNVFIYDYAGYGRSTGTPTEATCYADAEAALAYCLGRADVDSTRVAYLGWSLGSFMAMHLAADIRPPCALVLEAPIASTSALTKEGAVLSIPGSFVANADFDNETRIQRLDTTRVLIIYGRQDATCLPARHGEVLLAKAQAAQVRAEGLPIDCGGHSNIPEALGYDVYRQKIRAFIGTP